MTKTVQMSCVTHACWHQFNSSWPEHPDKPIKLVTRGWCLSCRFHPPSCMLDLHQLGPDTAGYRSVSVYICPRDPEARPAAGTQCSVWWFSTEGTEASNLLLCNVFLFSLLCPLATALRMFTLCAQSRCAQQLGGIVGVWLCIPADELNFIGLAL